MAFYSCNGIEMSSADMSDILSPLPSARGNWVEYSTTEQRVGTWIDGKPIYQKTINYGSTVSVGTTEKQTELADLTSLGIDTLVDMWGKFFSSGGSMIKVFNSSPSAMTVELYVSSNKLYLQSVRGSSTVTLSEIYVTIQYTKTTD